MFYAVFGPLFYALFSPLFHLVFYLWFDLMFHPCFILLYAYSRPFKAPQIPNYPSFLSRILHSEYCIEVDKKHTSNVQDTVNFTPQSPLFSLSKSVQRK